MKNVIALIMVCIMCLSFAACGSVEESPIDATETNPVVSTAQVGETVSTDIVDFTLDHGKLTYYVSNSSVNYVEATDEPNSLYAAKMGTCFVSMTVTISNKDRGGNLNLLDDLYTSKWTVTYNGEDHQMYGFDLNVDDYPYIKLSNGAIIDKSTGKSVKCDTGNKLLDAGETITLRFFGIIKTDPDSLNDGFELNIKVPDSKGEMVDYKYIVPSI